MRGAGPNRQSAPPHLVARQRFRPRRDEPPMSERLAQDAAAYPEDLVGNGAQHFRPGLDGLAHGRSHVLDVEVGGDRRPPSASGPTTPPGYSSESITGESPSRISAQPPFPSPSTKRDGSVARNARA